MSALSYFLIVVAAFLGGCGLDDTQSEEQLAVRLATASEREAVEVIDHSYIVTFRDLRSGAPTGFASFLAEYRFHYNFMAETYLTDPRVKDMTYITDVDLSYPSAGEASPGFEPPPALHLAWGQNPLAPLKGIMARVDFTGDEAAASLLSEWEGNGRLWFAEPNYINRLLQDNPFKGQKEKYEPVGIWWHKQIKLYQALEKLAAATTTFVEPVIAVLDSGVDIQHPLLRDRIWTNPSVGQAGCKNDLNGCDTTKANKGQLGEGDVSPIFAGGYGQSCPSSGGGVSPECIHGTHVSGIIAGIVDRSQEVGGVCPVCKILPIKILQVVNGKPGAPDSAILNGLKYLTRFKSGNNGMIRAANTSFGKYQRTRSVALVVNMLKRSPYELLVVGAAGNEDSMLRVYPAALNDAVAVAATNTSGQKSSYSNFGPWVDIAAPGGEGQSKIVSTVPGGQSDGSQGTSMASPVVAGAAGLLLALDFKRSFNNLRDSLVTTSDMALYDPEAQSINFNYYLTKIDGADGRRPLLGSGMLDTSGAVDGKKTTELSGAGLNRVNRSCGVVGAGSAGRVEAIFALIFLPLILVALERQWRRYRPKE